MGYAQVLRKSNQRLNKKEIVGFDIETYNDANDFLCASFVQNDKKFISHDRIECIEYIKKLKKKIICATNLSFDFNGLLGGYAMNFETLYRGSDLLCATTYIYHNEFIHPQERKDRIKAAKTKKEIKELQNNARMVKFIDTMSYTPMSVEKLGVIVKIEKLKKPETFTKLPKTKKEIQYNIDYNINDSLISKTFIEFLFKGLGELGASIKLTIGSCALSLFRNKYLDTEYFRAPKDDILKMFNAYYGGRTECFVRGRLSDYTEMPYKMYDINSLYPFVMKNKYPNPNTMRHCYRNDKHYIEEYEGMSHVKIYCPYMKYPLLPMRTKDKLLFPVGEWSGWYCHNELREAVKLGYVIKKVKETYYFKETCEPFSEYVDALYKKRFEYKEQNSEMETITKLLLNSLYGKFGQKFIDKENVVSSLIFNPNDTKIKSYEIYNDNFVRVKEDREPSVFCMPMWAAYVTAYARIEIYKYIKEHNPLYVDTDSIITRNEIQTGKELGAMKCEMIIKDGILIKPKFYAVINKFPRKLFCPECKNIMEKFNDDEEYICREHNIILSDNKVKIKGVGRKLDFEIFKKTVYGKEHTIEYTKFVKFKESMRREIKVNSIIPMIKTLDLFDTKRMFNHKNFNLLSDSEPININDKRIKPVLYTEQIKCEVPL
jgi:hypothetical protein